MALVWKRFLHLKIYIFRNKILEKRSSSFEPQIALENPKKCAHFQLIQPVNRFSFSEDIKYIYDTWENVNNHLELAGELWFNVDKPTSTTASVAPH